MFAFDGLKQDLAYGFNAAILLAVAVDAILLPVLRPTQDPLTQLRAE
jgi:hypothetical protein